MTTTISSRWTPFYRYVVPVFVAASLAFAAYVTWRNPERQNLPPGIPPDYGWVIVVFTGALAMVILWWAIGGLKQVELDGDELIISDFRTEIRVPLATVDKISGRSLTDPPRYTIHFAADTEFGRRVRFIAPRRWGLMQRFRDPDEIVELRSAWEAARGATQLR